MPLMADVAKTWPLVPMAMTTAEAIITNMSKEIR